MLLVMRAFMYFFVRDREDLAGLLAVLKKGTNKLSLLEMKTDDSESTTTSLTNDENDVDIKDEGMFFTNTYSEPSFDGDFTCCHSHLSKNFFQYMYLQSEKFPVRDPFCLA